MAKGRAKTEWLNENEVKDILAFYIWREQNTIEKDGDIYHNVKVNLRTGYTDRYTFQYPNKSPYHILAIYLEDRCVENNIADYAEALMTQAYDSIIKHIRIERDSIFTKYFSMEMFIKLSRFVSGMTWEINGIYGGDIVEGSISRFSIWNIDNNKKLSYMFYLMENKGLLVPNWQNIIDKRGIAHTKKGKQLNAKDLNSALNEAKETADSTIKRKTQQEYEEIKRFIENL